MKVAFASTIAKKDFVINSEDLWNVIAPYFQNGNKKVP